MSSFDWHGGRVTRATPVTGSYRNTQNVRRFFKSECGDDFKFDRGFMAWIKTGAANTMGEAADEWRRRNAAKRRGFGASARDAVRRSKPKKGMAAE